jgi:hypothetical protein
MPSCVDFPESNRRLLTIDVPVGYGFDCKMQANLSEDVMLVQFMLLKLFERGFKGISLGSPLSVDGVFGMKTHYHLLLFQRSVYQTYTAYPNVNGTISPMDFSRPMDQMTVLNEHFFTSIGVCSWKSLYATLPVALQRPLSYSNEERGRPMMGAIRSTKRDQEL